MNWHDAQLALRHGCRIVAAPPFLALIGLITLIGSLFDRPGQTGLSMALGFALHLARNLVGATVATLVIVVLARALPRRVPVLLRLALAGLAAAPLVHGTMAGGDAVTAGHWPSWAFAGWPLARDAIMVSAIAVVVGLFRADRPRPAGREQPAATPQTERSAPALLRRLPPDLGTDLVRVSACDHYVQVQTRAGATLILLRLADALDELAGVPGMQIHRSHWVAHGAMAAVVVEQRRPLLVLDDGQRLPISRSRLSHVRGALADRGATR